MDANATINGNLNIAGVNNVIVRNLNVTHPGSVVDPATGKYSDGGDGISIWGATNVFITQCTFVDCGDGECDITQGADNVTVSWCKFYYTAAAQVHRFPMILGNTDPTTGPDYHVTLHHNWWADGCYERMPSGSYSTAHIYNNYFSATGNYYATNNRVGSEWLIESNYYNGVKNPCSKQDGGKMYLSGNTFYNCTGDPGGWDSTVGAVTGNDVVILPNYSYSLHNTADVPSIVMAGAGNGGIPPTKNNQTVTFGPLSVKTYGDSPFGLTGTTSSGLAVSYTNSNPAVATVSGTTLTIVGSGTTTITAAQPGNAYYNSASSVAQPLVVHKAPQSITFATLPAKTYGDAPFGLAANASSSLAVSYTSSNASVATVSGSTVTIVGTGTTGITASQAGNTNYSAATNIQQSLVIYSPQAAWAASYGLDPATNGAPAADPDKDGIQNNMEFFLTGNPTKVDKGILPVASYLSVNGIQALVFEFNRNKAAAAMAFTVEYTSNPSGSWTAAAHGQNGITIVTTPVDANSDHITVTIPYNGSKLFARVRL